MYIVIEGMPGTGKTTIAKELALKLNADYMKSVISDTMFGDTVKLIRKENKKSQLEFLFLSDLALDELRAIKMASSGNVVRDKSLAATLGHIEAHGYENSDEIIQKCLEEGYKLIMKYSQVPDIAVLISADKKRVLSHFKDKEDVSDIDCFLLENYDLYLKQEESIRKQMLKIYNEKFYEIVSFSGSVDEMVEDIIKKVKK